jgi:hypothetical protein
MTINYYGNNTSSQITANVSNDTWIIADGTYVSVAGTALQGTGSFTNRTFEIDGHLFADGGVLNIGLSLGNDNGGGSSTVHVGANGSVYGKTDGAYIKGGLLKLTNDGYIGGGLGLYMDGDDNSVVNKGTIEGAGSFGLRSDGDNASIFNSGNISGVMAGLVAAGADSIVHNSGNIFSVDPDEVTSYGVNATAALDLVNDGTISGGTGMTVDGGTTGSHIVNNGKISGASGAGLEFTSGQADLVENHGTITGKTHGIEFDSNGGYIYNYGDITSENIAVSMSGFSLLSNFGTISGKGWGNVIEGEASSQYINNYGAIKGDVDLGDGGDSVEIHTGYVFGNIYLDEGNVNSNSDGFYIYDGKLKGNVYGGGGADSFQFDGGKIAGFISGGDGDDNYYINIEGVKLSEGPSGGYDDVYCSVSFDSTAGIEYIRLLGTANLYAEGNELDNTILGNSGANALLGMEGNDLLITGLGATKIDGGLGVDTVVYLSSSERVVVNLATGVGKGGNAKGDQLISVENIQGSIFNDQLTGSSSDNILSGHFGNDMLTGGAGKDIFEFKTGWDEDTIRDFENGADKLDLSSWLAIDSFTDLKANHLSVSGKNLIIHDGTDELVLLDTKKIELDASDFIFA